MDKSITKSKTWGDEVDAAEDVEPNIEPDWATTSEEVETNVTEGVELEEWSINKDACGDIRAGLEGTIEGLIERGIIGSELDLGIRKVLREGRCVVEFGKGKLKAYEN